MHFMTDMICRKMSAGRGVLRAASFASSSASAFLFLSIYSMVKPLKTISILLTKARYLLRVGLPGNAFFFYMSCDHLGICANDAPLNTDSP
jgi:hypothetical protein